MATLSIGRVRPVYKGEWDDVTTYTALDFVLHTDDVLYIALKDVPANYEPLAQAEYWAPFGSKGMPGNGIQSFVFVEQQPAGNLWKMTFTDSTTADILVPKGDQGVKGNGIVSITFVEVLDNGDYKYAVTLDDGKVEYITAPRGPEVRLIRRPTVTIIGAPTVNKSAFKVSISPFAALFGSVFEERVIDIALDSAFTQLVVTATITPEDEDKNLYTVPQQLLNYATTYYARARDMDAAGQYSDYSVAVFATTDIEVREINKPEILFPAASEVIATLIPSFTFSAPTWVASTGNIDQMQVIVSRGATVIYNSAWVSLVPLFTPTDFEYEWGRDYSVTVQYKESATGLVSPISDVRAYTTRAAYVVMPTVVFPNADALISLTGIAIQSSAFSSVGATDTHRASRWFIYGDAAGTDLLWDSGRSTLNLTSITANPTPVLAADKSVWIAVVYEGELLGQSARSPLLAVKTGKVVVPTIVAPTAGEILFRTVTVATSPFSVTAGVDTHLTTDYKITSDELGVDVVAQALESADKLSHTFEAFEFTDGSTYYAWAAHNGSTYGASAFSAPVAFVLKNAIDAHVVQGDQYFTNVQAACALPDGGVIIAGGGVCARLTSDGSLMWARYGLFPIINSVVLLDDSNFIVAHGIRGRDGDDSDDYYLTRFDIFGNGLWQHTAGIGSKPNTLRNKVTRGVAAVSGELIYSAAIAWYAYGPNTAPLRLRLLCFDRNGAYVWGKDWHGTLLSLCDLHAANSSALYVLTRNDKSLQIIKWNMEGVADWGRTVTNTEASDAAVILQARLITVGDKVVVAYTSATKTLTLVILKDNGDFVRIATVEYFSNNNLEPFTLTALSDTEFAVAYCSYAAPQRLNLLRMSVDLGQAVLKNIKGPLSTSDPLQAYKSVTGNLVIPGTGLSPTAGHAGLLYNVDIDAGDYSCGPFTLTAGGEAPLKQRNVQFTALTVTAAVLASYAAPGPPTITDLPTMPTFTVYPARALS